MSTNSSSSSTTDGPWRIRATIRTPKVSEIVARQLVQEIAGDELSPGTKLPPESEMLGRFGVGRGSLREALRILEVHGVVSIRPGSRGGPILEDIGSVDFARMSTLFYFLHGATYGDILEARLIMDPVMAKLAADRRDPDGVRELQQAVDYARSIPSSDSPDWKYASSYFHLVVAGMSGNHVLDLLGRALMHIWTARVKGFVFPEHSRDEVHDVHGEIAEAIIAGDGERAGDLMRSHMQEFADFASERYPGFLDELVQWHDPLDQNR
jgi:GntR family transcriptional repressor for pyruvate dehydrogenase complex